MEFVTAPRDRITSAIELAPAVAQTRQIIEHFLKGGHILLPLQSGDWLDSYLSLLWPTALFLRQFLLLFFLGPSFSSFYLSGVTSDMAHQTRPLVPCNQGRMHCFPQLTLRKFCERSRKSGFTG